MPNILKHSDTINAVFDGIVKMTRPKIKEIDSIRML